MSIASSSENTTKMQFDKQPSITPARAVEKHTISTFIKSTIDPSVSISFYLGFLILFTQSMIGGKKWLLTLWMSYDGVHRRRVLFYIFVAAAASLATALSFDQFIHHCNNAVQALPHTGPHPVLKRAWVSLWIFIAKPRWGKIRWIPLRTAGRGAIMQTEWL